MNSYKLVIPALALGLATLFGCDQSKAELQQTKASLASITAERDNLKTQLDHANQRNTQLQQQLSELQSKVQAAAPAETGMPATGAPATNARQARSGTKRPAPAAKPATTPEQQRQIEQVEKKANTGGGHF